MAIAEVLQAARLLAAAEVAGEPAGIAKLKGDLAREMAALSPEARDGIERESARLQALLQAQDAEDPDAQEHVKRERTRKRDGYSVLIREVATERQSRLRK